MGWKTRSVGKLEVQESVGLDRREDFENVAVQQDGRQMYLENELHTRMQKIETKTKQREALGPVYKEVG